MVLPVAVFCLVIFVWLLGLIVASKDIKSRQNLVFVIFSIANGLWIAANFLGANYKEHNFANFFIHLDFILAPLLALTSWLFARSVVKNLDTKYIKLKFVDIILIVLGASASVLTLAGYVISIPFENGQFVIKYGPANDLYSLAVGISFIACLLLLFYGRHRSMGRERAQISSIFLGFAAAVTLLFFANVIFPIINGSANANLIIGNISYVGFAFMVAMSAYAIIRHRLFDIRAIVSRSLAYIVSLALIVTVYIALTFLVFNTFLFSENNVSLVQTLAFTVVAVLLSFSFQPIRIFFNKVTNRIFYRDAYNAQELLNAVNSSIVSSTDLYKLLEQTSKEIKVNLKASFCNFYIDNKAVIDFHVVGTDAPMFAKDEWDPLLEALNKSEGKIFSEVHVVDEKTSGLMHDLNVEIILKMTSQDQNVGYLIVGQKQSGSSFSGQDLQVLEIIADEVAIAVQNTLRYEEITLFNVTLQKKIDNATAELQRTNTKLKTLDEAKDEFISMASHQLRTPLTSVKGYISMLIEGDAGVLNDQQRKFLEQAYVSSQRMVYLIADLLNVSRLKTGKFVIELKPTYLPDVVESELAQLDETAKARGLELIFNKPSEFPILNLDETKIRQVIMNFADNAIYYTPKDGRITVNLKQTADTIELTVTDTGIGVPKADQHKMFTKFYRAGNARKARPDGTGLGIFMAKKVVVAQGGAIIFKTTEGKGSTFGFTFPRAKLELPPIQK